MTSLSVCVVVDVFASWVSGIVIQIRRRPISTHVWARAACDMYSDVDALCMEIIRFIVWRRDGIDPTRRADISIRPKCFLVWCGCWAAGFELMRLTCLGIRHTKRGVMVCPGSAHQRAQFIGVIIGFLAWPTTKCVDSLSKSNTIKKAPGHRIYTADDSLRLSLSIRRFHISNKWRPPPISVFFYVWLQHIFHSTIRKYLPNTR